MAQPRSWTTTLLAVGAALLASACSEESGPAPFRPGTTTSSGGTGGTATGSGGAGGDVTTGGGGTGGAGQGGGGAAQTGPLGTLPIEAVADTSCVAKGGSVAEVYGAAATPPRFDRLVTVGTRRAAQEASIGGFVVMDLDGANPSPEQIFASVLHNQIASEGSTLGVAAVGEQLHYQRFDDQGAPAGALLDVSSDGPAQLAIAGSGGAALLGWKFDDTLRARGIASGGSFAGPTVDVAAAGAELAIVAAAAPAGFALAWSEDAGADGYRTYFVRTGPDGSGGTPVEVTREGERHEVVRLVPTPTGHVLLINGGPPTYAAYAVLFDAEGQVASPAYELEGAFFAWDVAAFGSELGVVASRASDEPEFRPFDAAFAPLGPWVCLDGATGTSEPTAIDVDPNGYAVLYRTPAGATNLARFDHLGTGAQ